MKIRKRDMTPSLLPVLFFSILFFIMLIAFGEIIIERDSEHEESLVHDYIYNTGAIIAQDIQRNITSGIYATESLHGLLKLNDFDVSQFSLWGENIISTNPIVSVVQLAPEGVVTYCYPLKGNEAAIGHDLLKDKRRDDGALKAIESRDLTFIGPVKLIQNNRLAVIARKPIFVMVDGKERFWGFSIALFYMEDLLPKELTKMEEEGFLIALRGDDPDAEERPNFLSSPDYDAKDEITIDIEVPNGRWELGLNHPPLINRYYKIIRITVFFVALILSVFIFIQQFRIKLKTFEIQNLNKRLLDLSLQDELTGLPNRRSALQTMERLVSVSKRYDAIFSIAIIDFDHFKEINDNYGHPVGDKYLKHFAHIMQEITRESDFCARIGGDEFILFFPGTNLKDSLIAINKLVKMLKDNPYKSLTGTLPIQLSIGVAEFDKNESVDTLMTRADEQLYNAKNTGRDKICWV